MPRIRYVGPIVGVDVVIAGLSAVEPGDEFDVDEAAATHLLADDSIYVPADEAAQLIADSFSVPADEPDTSTPASED
jgi:hypothetical protein